MRMLQGVEAKPTTATGSYRRILKSTSIMGGSAVIGIILRICRVKVLAVLLGPAGLGLVGIYNSIIEMAATTVGMGIDSSGVRQIAAAVGTRGDAGIARSVYAIRRVSLLLGLFGMMLLIVLSIPISRLTFGNADHALDVVVLSSVILLTTVMNGKVALIQGMRRIGDLAQLNILGALFGTVLGIPILYVWGQGGIIWFLVAVSGTSLLATWWFAERIEVPHVQMSWEETRTEINPLFRLGFALMLSALTVKGTMYLLTVLVARKLSLEAVGLYQASMTLSSIYVSFILDSMIKDYIPRLTAVAHDHPACNKLVNEQVEIGLLLSLPGILATITFAPLVIKLFYSAAFVAAFQILRWQILGTLLQVVSWPVAFVMQAKGRGGLFLLTVFASSAVHVGLASLGISYLGLSGTGVAFLGMGIFYAIVTYRMAKHFTGFSWSHANMRLALLMVPVIGLLAASSLFLGHVPQLIVGSLLCVATGGYSVKCLLGIVSPDGFFMFLARIKERSGLAAA